VFLEIAIVIALTLINGALAMSELAVVSSRPARLNVMVEQGNRGAATAQRLASDPGRFLSSVQIGITLVGVLSGAFSGATLGTPERLPRRQRHERRRLHTRLASASSLPSSPMPR
jgi:putative hemolysin